MTKTAEHYVDGNKLGTEIQMPYPFPVEFED